MKSRCVQITSGFPIPTGRVSNLLLNCCVFVFILAVGVPWIGARSAFAEKRNSESDLPPEKFTRISEEKTFSSVGMARLMISNPYGSIRLQPSSRESVRVKADFILPETLYFSSTESSATNTDRKTVPLSIQHENHLGEWRVFLGFPVGLSLAERQRLRKNFRGQVDLSVEVPKGVSLVLQTVDGAIEISKLEMPASAIEISTQKGAVSMGTSSFSRTQVRCSDCTFLGRSLRGYLHIVGGAGDMVLRQIQAPELFVSTSSGKIELSDSASKKVLSTRSGSIEGDSLKGITQVVSSEGTVRLEGEGEFVVSSPAGSVELRLAGNGRNDKTLVETQTGSIRFVIESAFSGALEATTRSGEVRLDSPLSVKSGMEAASGLPSLRESGGSSSQIYGPQQDRRRALKIGAGQLSHRLKSNSGVIDVVLRRNPI